MQQTTSVDLRTAMVRELQPFRIESFVDGLVEVIRVFNGFFAILMTDQQDFHIINPRNNIESQATRVSF